MTDWNAVSAFMGAVVPWPASSQDAGWVVMPNGYPDKNTASGRLPSGKYPIGAGRAFKTVDDFVNFVGWATQQHFYKDLFFCLSLQRDVATSRNGKPKGKRSAAGAMALKAVWLDVDVGKEDGYPTLQDALKALIDFQQRNNLPKFSAIVASGGGLQPYWISKTAMTQDEWRPYAEGLKALAASQLKIKPEDLGLTTDPARVLRVPGSFNHKLATPRPVQLLNLPLVTYDFPTQLGTLPQITPLAPVSKPTQSVFFDPAAFRGVTPILKATADDKLGAGIDQYADLLLDPRPIFKDCGFFRSALATGGKDYGQQLWMYSVLGTTFMENGNDIAHKISKGHATYTAADTDAMFNRKLAERTDRGIGYPSCSAIAGAGCKACQTCPLLNKGKSPLNLRPTVTAAVIAPPVQSPVASALNLPEGYDIDADGHIVKVIEKTDREGKSFTQHLKLFLSRLSNPWVEGGKTDAIHVVTSYDKGRSVPASLKWEDFGAQNISNILSHQKIKVKPENKKYLEEFLTSWLAKLHEMSAAQDSVPFGWFRDPATGVIKGFAYGGTLFKDDGTEGPCGHGDAQLRQIFQPVGSLDKWYAAERCITNQQRPELDAIIALSFSAPLMSLIGLNAATLSCWGDSAAGKSSAYSVGISVWGHSKKGKAVSHSTFNGVMKKMGQLVNLPFYWDEIKDVKAQQAVYDYIYTASDGVEKDRAKSDTSLQERGTWQTQMMMAANISFIDYVIKRDASHIAGVSRVLEYNIKVREDGPGRISSTAANVIIDALQTNYGQMGMLYAKYLAVNHAAVAAECVKTCQDVEKDLGYNAAERFWVGLVGTLLVGARIANELGANIGLERLKAFLYDVYLANRTKRNSLTQISGTKASTEAIMTGYFDYVQAQDQILWTTGMSTGPGKPGAVSVLHQPKDVRNAQALMSIAVRFDASARRCLIVKDHLIDYLNERGLGFGTVLDSLKANYGMEIREKLRIGAGTLFDNGRKTLCVVENIGADHDWAGLLYRWTPEKERPAEPDEHLETGIVIDQATGLATAASVQAFVQGATGGH
jgi:hypothetical protein